MPFRIIRNDITRVRADAIVTASSPASGERLPEERPKAGLVQAGGAAAEPAHGIPAKYIIRTAGPEWIDGRHGEAEILASCYRSCLLLARRMGLASIAFPLIAAEAEGFPKDKALAAALSAISGFLEKHDMDVTLVVVQRGAVVLSAALDEDVRRYIDKNYETQVRSEKDEEHALPEKAPGAEGLFPPMGPAVGISLPGAPHEDSLAEEAVLFDSCCIEELPKKRRVRLPAGKASAAALPGRSLSELMDNIGESFSKRLLRLIREKGLEETDVYKKAFLDRKLFSKIRRNPDYSPKKQTAVALALAMRLNRDETVDLLNSAGLALSRSSKFDLIVLYCLENGIYDLFEINALLFKYGQPMLGC